MAVVASLSWMKRMHLSSYFGGGNGDEQKRNILSFLHLRTAEQNQACIAVSLQRCSKGSQGSHSREAEASWEKWEEEQNSTKYPQNILEFPPVSEEIYYSSRHKAHTVCHASHFCQVFVKFRHMDKNNTHAPGYISPVYDMQPLKLHIFSR